MVEKQDKGNLKNKYRSSKSNVELFLKNADPDVSRSFEKLHWEVMKDGNLSKKEKLVVAVACAVAVKCENCVKNFSKKAVDSGIKPEELFEAVAVAALVSTGSVFNFGSCVLDSVKEAD